MGSARSITGWIHGTREGLDHHAAAGEEPCKECVRAEKKRVAEARARQAGATPEQVEDFIRRCRDLMAERDWTVHELARQLQAHSETVRLTLNGTNWPKKHNLSRLAARLTELEDGDAFQHRQALADRARLVREQHNKLTYDKWRQARQERLKLRTSAQRELVRQ